MSATLRLAVDVKLLQHIKESGDEGITSVALSEKTGVDIVLLQRLTRLLASMFLVKYHDGKWHGTPISNGLAAQNYQESIAFCYDVSSPSFAGFPSYFKSTNYRSPSSLTSGPFQHAHQTSQPFFDWLVATPPHLQRFGAFMTAYRAGKAAWYNAGFYPVAERLIAGFSPAHGTALLVDVGGGHGQDVSAFAAAHPSHPGQIILQDRSQVIATIPTDEPLPYTAEAHDFFTPQPIKAARAYSLHSILHDWGDEDGLRILENLKPALKPGYSRVLLNEIVVSETNPTLAATAMDNMMLAHFAVRERTEAEWRAILEKAGLKLLKIYAYPGVAESVIEAELPLEGVEGLSI